MGVPALEDAPIRAKNRSKGAEVRPDRFGTVDHNQTPLTRLSRYGIIGAMGFFSELIEAASTRATRSTALQPLLWLVGIMLLALVTLVQVRASEWLVISLAVAVG